MSIQCCKREPFADMPTMIPPAKKIIQINFLDFSTTIPCLICLILKKKGSIFYLLSYRCIRQVYHFLYPKLIYADLTF
jgi:hypothetical protein